MDEGRKSLKFHLLHPASRQELSWGECKCLCHALGYEEASLEETYKLAVDSKFHSSFRLSQLEPLLRSEFFKTNFDFSYNCHSCEWNEQVLRRAVVVVASRLLTFEELYQVRVAYGMYESSDLKGMEVSPALVPLRALKLCGRVMSSKKLSHRVKHMSDTFQEPGRLQLDEFIDLALWADSSKKQEQKVAAVGSAQSVKDQKTKLWSLEDFNDILSPLDERIQRNLNADYAADELQYVQEKLKGDQSLRYHSVLQLPRSRRCGSATRITSAASASRPTTSHQSLSSLSGSRPVTPSCSTPGVSGSRRVQSARELYRKISSCSVVAEKFRSQSAPIPRHRRLAPPIVSEDDMEQTGLLLDALTFTQSALPQFYQRWTAEDMETLRPGFSERHVIRLEEAEVAAEERNKILAAQRKEQEATERRRRREEQRKKFQENLRHLSCRQPPQPLPSHARICSAAVQQQQPATRQHPQLLPRQDKERPKSSGQQQPLSGPDSHQVPAGGREVQLKIEPALGLNLPLTQQPAVKCRFNYSRTCVPQVHPVQIDFSNGDKGRA